jgi:predicted nucleotidyltransferase
MPATQKKTSQQTAIKLASEYVMQCHKLNIPIIKAILFGSQVNGKPHSESDIDLLLVSEKFKNNSLDNWKLLAPVF